MAYVATEDEDEEQQQQQQGTERVLSSDSGDVDAGAGQGAAAPTGSSSPKATRGAAGWTNLQNYVSANQGNDSKMAEDVRGSVKAEADKATTGSSTYGQNAEKTIQAGTVQANPDVVGQLKSNAKAVAGDASQRAALDAQLNADYSGPNAANEIDGFDDTAHQYGLTTSIADSAQDFEGRGTLLDSVYGRPSYTRGEKNLDSFLLGNGDAKDVTEGITRDYGTQSEFGKGWQGLVDSVSGNIDAGKATTQATADAAKAALGSAVADIDKRYQGFEGQAQSANASRAAVVGAVQAQLASRDPGVRAKAFAALGMDPAAGEWLLKQGYSPAQLVAQGSARTAADFATAADRDQLAALYDLNGGSADAGWVNGSGGGAAFTGSQGAADAGKAYQQKTALETKLATAQKTRDNEFGALRGALVGTLGSDDHATEAKLGIPSGTINEARSLGIDPSQFLHAGAKLNLGDVASANDRKGWGGLVKALGLKNGGGLSLDDTQNEGAAWAFDLAGLRAAMDNAVNNRRNPWDTEAQAPAPAAESGSAPGFVGTGAAPFSMPDVSNVPGAPTGLLKRKRPW